MLLLQEQKRVKREEFISRLRSVLIHLSQDTRVVYEVNTRVAVCRPLSFTVSADFNSIL